jgi:hypothetical protein
MEFPPFLFSAMVRLRHMIRISLYPRLGCIRNLGDVAIGELSKQFFSRIGLKMSLSPVVVLNFHRDMDDAMIMSGGSLFNRNVLQVISELMKNHRHTRKVIFGTGCEDDNPLLESWNRSLLNSILDSTMATATTGYSFSNRSSWNFPVIDEVYLDFQSQIKFRDIDRGEVYGEIRGPLSARFLSQYSRSYNAGFSAANFVLGDSGLLVKHYLHADRRLLQTLGLFQQKYATFVVSRIPFSTGS